MINKINNCPGSCQGIRNIRIGSTNFKGRKYTIFTYDKNYTCLIRFKKFFEAFFLTLLTAGFALCSSKILKSFSKAVKGHAIKILWINNGHASLEKLAILKAYKELPADSFTQTLRRYNDLSLSPDILPVCATTNEFGKKAVRAVLQSTPRKDPCIHIGFSAWHNFNIINERRSTYALLVDSNSEVTLFLYQTLVALRMSVSRKEFLQNIFNIMKKSNIHLDFALKNGSGIKNNIREEFNRKGSWLSTEDGFQYIKNMVENDRIALITNNITRADVFKAIHKELQIKSLPVDTLYISNIEDYMGHYRSLKHKCFNKTILSLIKNDTLVIDANDDLKQSIQTGLQRTQLMSRLTAYYSSNAP